MSTYKVIQDIEAEDHILGPLSLRQFIYGLVGAFFYYLSFIVLTKHLAFAIIFFLPPALFCTFFAFPFGQDQPTEVWALAKIRFFFKPRRRIWDQAGIKELVTITVPKKIEIHRTDGLSQTEVKSRLRALADTIDTRGWAIKNVAPNKYTRPGMQQSGNSERLLDFTSMPQSVPDYVDDPGADMLDNQASPIAQQFGTMIQDASQRHREQLMATMKAKQDTTKHLQWFSPNGQSPTAVPTSDQQYKAQLAADLAAQAQAHVPAPQPAAQPVQASTPQVQPMTYQTPVPAPIAPVQPPQPPMPTPTDPAILNLAKRDDLNVATLAREAQRAKGLDNGEEVVISLH